MPCGRIRGNHQVNLAQYPKVELHLHFDCAFSYQAVAKIDPSITREAFAQKYIGPVKCSSLADYLKYATGYKLMQTAENLRIVVDDVFDQLAQDNVMYAELRFAPFLHLERGLTPEAVVETVENAVDKAV